MPKTYQIVGQKFIGLDPYLPGTLAGAEALLVREPTNAYDPNAVQVWVSGSRVGYIPKKDNAALAQFIDQAGAPMALDSATSAERVLRATFRRSPNSGYPQVEVDG